MWFFFFFSSRRRHTRCSRDWSSDVCSSDLHASAALARSEAAEAANLDLFALLQSADDALEYGLYNCFGLFARELRHVQNFLDQVGLGECRCALLGHLAMPRRAVPQRTA